MTNLIAVSLGLLVLSILIMVISCSIAFREVTSPALYANQKWKPAGATKIAAFYVFFVSLITTVMLLLLTVSVVVAALVRLIGSLFLAN